LSNTKKKIQDTAWNLGSVVLLIGSGACNDIQPQAFRVEVQFVLSTGFLEELGDDAGILDLPELDVAPALLNGIADELSGAGFTLCADDCGLFLLACLVDDESGSLGLLLSYLLGFDGCGEFGRESEVLLGIPVVSVLDKVMAVLHTAGERFQLTVKETSSSVMLKREARLARFSRTRRATISR
jgi:hypothetical protein